MLGLGEGHKDASLLSKKLEKIEFEGQIVYTDPLGADSMIVDVNSKKVKETLN